MKKINFELDIIKTIKTVKKGDQIVFGYASTYDIDTDDVQITRKALESAKDDLLKYSTVLFNHDPDRPIGKVIETEVDDIGLLVKIVLSKEEEDIWKKVQEGIINKFSIQGRSSGLKSIEGNGQISQIEEIQLVEVSLVSVPANVKAETISYYVAKSLNNETLQNNNMKNLIKKLKEISKNTDDKSKEELDKLVKEIEEKEDMLTNLHVIAGKLSDDDKKVLDSAIEYMKEEKKLSDEVNEYNLEDVSDARPVFQLDAIEKFEFDEKDNKLRKQVLKIGKLYHHSAQGGILNITSDVIDNIVKNFNKKTIENVSIPLTHTDDPSKNTGEVVKLIKTDDGLDAICEIKDESILEKIKKGLIKQVSVSLDSNYRIKTSNKFVGPTLLHLALVAESYMKKLNGFIPLADEYKDRNFIQLEDKEPNLFESMNELKNEVNAIKKEMKEQKDLNETFAIITKDEETEEEEEEKKSEYSDCMAKEMKNGKSMQEASDICKEKTQKTIDKEETEEEIPEDTSEIKSEEESGETAQPKVDLADAEKVYENYLREGKIVPAQKNAFIKLLSSNGAIELAEGNKVELSKSLKTFLEAQPKVLNFDELGNENAEAIKEDKEESTSEEVKDFFTEKMGLSDKDAEKAWKDAKKTSDTEKQEKESMIL